jgi:hypothetical protein
VNVKVCAAVYEFYREFKARGKTRGMNS